MAKQTKLTKHQLKMLDEANMRMSAITGSLLNAECTRELTTKMSQAKNDAVIIQQAIHNLYNTYK